MAEADDDGDDDEEVPPIFFSPGMVFWPTELMIVEFFLIRKLLGRHLHAGYINAIDDIYGHHPGDLALDSSYELDTFGSQIWDYFFAHRRPDDSDRAVPGGYWKVKNGGKEKEVVNASGRVVGYKKDLVFCNGSDGVETKFGMEEYRVNREVLSIQPQDRLKNENLVLCKIYKILCPPWQSDEYDYDGIIYHDNEEEMDDRDETDDGEEDMDET